MRGRGHVVAQVDPAFIRRQCRAEAGIPRRREGSLRGRRKGDGKGAAQAGFLVSVQNMERRTYHPGKHHRHQLVRNFRKIKEHGQLRLLIIRQVDSKSFRNQSQSQNQGRPVGGGDAPAFPNKSYTWNLPFFSTLVFVCEKEDSRKRQE